MVIRFQKKKKNFQWSSWKCFFPFFCLYYLWEEVITVCQSIFLLFWLFKNRCDISLSIATSKRNHWYRRQETERNLCCQIQEEGWDGQRKALWNWFREGRRMWYMHGDEQQGRIAHLQSFYVHEVLPKLVCWLLHNS